MKQKLKKRKSVKGRDKKPKPKKAHKTDQGMVIYLLQTLILETCKGVISLGVYSATS